LLDVNAITGLKEDSVETKEIVEGFPSSQESVSAGSFFSNSASKVSEDTSTSMLLSHVNKYEIVLTGERSWVSQCVDLFPGEYQIIVSFDYGMRLQEIRKRALPRDVSQAPWIHPKQVNLLLNDSRRNEGVFHAKKFVASNSNQSFAIEDKNKGKNMTEDSDEEAAVKLPQDDDNRSQSSLQELEKKLFSGKAGPTKAELLKEIEEENKLLLEHRICLETTTIELLDLKPYYSHVPDIDQSADLMAKKLRYDIAEPLLPTKIRVETWPFVTESQLEVCSRLLYNTMAALREESEYVAEEFIGFANKYKEERKAKIMTSKVAPAKKEKPST
jgi:hypothetical protein